MTDFQSSPPQPLPQPAGTGPVAAANTFTRHRGPITCVAGIPGRAAAVTSGYDSAVGLVDFERGVIALLGYHDHLVNRVVVNPAGTLAATCSSDYTVGLWDLERRTLVRVLRGHWDDVEDFAFVNETTGVSVSRDRRILIWNLNTGAVTRVLEKHQRDVLSIDYARGHLYSSGDDMTLRQWDADTGDLLRTWGPFEVETDTCAIDPLHDRVFLGCDDGKIRIFDCASGEPVRQINAHNSGIKKVAISPVNGDVLSAAYDQRILVWDAVSGEIKQQLEGHPAAWERSFNWAPDGNSILAGTFDGTVLQWELATGLCTGEVGIDGRNPGNACINDISASESGCAAIVCDDGLLRVTNLSDQDSPVLQPAESGNGRILMNAVCLLEKVAFRRPNDLVLAGAHDQNLHAFSLANGCLEHSAALSLDEGPINCIRARDIGSGHIEAFVACYSGSVVRVKTEGESDLQVVNRFPVHDGAVKSLRLHPAGETGVSCAADGSMCAWDFEGNTQRSYIGHTAIVDDLDFEPEGDWLASVSRDFTVNVYEYATGLMRHSILLGRESPKCVIFWSKEQLFVGNYWGDIWRVDLASESVAAFRVASNGISSMSRSGPYLAAASYDGTVCLLEPASMKVVGRKAFMQQRTGAIEQSASFS